MLDPRRRINPGYGLIADGLQHHLNALLGVRGAAAYLIHRQGVVLPSSRIRSVGDGIKADINGMERGLNDLPMSNFLIYCCVPPCSY